MGMRAQFKEAFLKKFGIKLGFMSAFVKASAFALQDQPVVNAVIDDMEIVYRDYVDISVAVSTPKVQHGTQKCGDQEFGWWGLGWLGRKQWGWGQGVGGGVVREKTGRDGWLSSW